ncbi:hypothetical protein [Spirosoma arcticum]
MQINVTLTDPVTLATAFALLALLAVQGWFIVRNKTLSPGRKTLRAALNALMWLVVAGYVLKISWPVDRPITHALLVGDDVPAAYARTVQDSLRIRERFTTQTFKNSHDSVTLVGQGFPTETLTQLSQSVVRWVPYDAPNQLKQLRWKGVVRQGEMQWITGKIRSNSKQRLRIQYGNQTLDSLMLSPGGNTVALQFPVFGRGRLQTELRLGNQPLDTVRFYSRPATPLFIQFVLDNPDFESKTLADWLGKQGHSVEVSTTLATNVRSRVDINRSPKATGRKPDVVITDPINAANTLVRNAVAGGKAVLFINLSSLPTDITRINRALKTRWQVRKISDQETVPAGSGLTAHPYRFANALNQFAVPAYPVAAQQVTGRVGVSLLNETFPLALSGDSLAYGRIWYGILARLQPAEKNNLVVDAPVFSGLLSSVYVNNSVIKNAVLRVGADTSRLTQSPLNQQSAVGTLFAKQAGWQPIQDSLAFYVDNLTDGSSVANRQVISRFMVAHSTYQSAPTGPARQRREAAGAPGWVWLTLFVVCLTALWIEPKIT